MTPATANLLSSSVDAAEGRIAELQREARGSLRPSSCKITASRPDRQLPEPKGGVWICNRGAGDYHDDFLSYRVTLFVPKGDMPILENMTSGALPGPTTTRPPRSMTCIGRSPTSVPYGDQRLRAHRERVDASVLCTGLRAAASQSMWHVQGYYFD